MMRTRQQNAAKFKRQSMKLMLNSVKVSLIQPKIPDLKPYMLYKVKASLYAASGSVSLWQGHAVPKMEAGAEIERLKRKNEGLCNDTTEMRVPSNCQRT